jgi:hypothetical protein
MACLPGTLQSRTAHWPEQEHPTSCSQLHAFKQQQQHICQLLVMLYACECSWCIGLHVLLKLFVTLDKP